MCAHVWATQRLQFLLTQSVGATEMRPRGEHARPPPLSRLAQVCWAWPGQDLQTVSWMVPSHSSCGLALLFLPEQKPRYWQWLAGNGARKPGLRALWCSPLERPASSSASEIKARPLPCETRGRFIRSQTQVQDCFHAPWSTQSPSGGRDVSRSPHRSRRGRSYEL